MRNSKQFQTREAEAMEDKGWLKGILEQARREVKARPRWQRDRVISSEPQQQRADRNPTKSDAEQTVERERKLA